MSKRLTCIDRMQFTLINHLEMDALHGSGIIESHTMATNAKQKKRNAWIFIMDEIVDYL